MGSVKKSKTRARIVHRIVTQFPIHRLLIALWVPGCSGVHSSLDDVGSLPAGETSRPLTLRILSGQWEYREGALVHELILDDRGNGSY